MEGPTELGLREHLPSDTGCLKKHNETEIVEKNANLNQLLLREITVIAKVRNCCLVTMTVTRTKQRTKFLATHLDFQSSSSIPCLQAVRRPAGKEEM